MYTTPAPPDVTRRRNSGPSTSQGTLGSLEGKKGQNSSIFPGFVALPTIFLVIVAACILWNWNKRKKRRVPYFQVAPSLTLPPPRQRAKNIYDFLPQQQAELGRHQSNGFSTENLLSRDSDSPEHEATPADGPLQIHRASVHAVEYTVGIYDNGTVPQMCGHLASSDISVRTSRNNSSISSEESNDYVNIPTAEETSETLTSTKSTPENHCGLPSAQKLELAEGGRAGCGAATNHTGLWTPGRERRASLSDGEESSQTSNDYVNMTGLDLDDIQENQPGEAFQGCRDYENVPAAADTNGGQLQTREEVTSSHTDHGELVWGALSSVYYMAFQPSPQSEDSEVAHEEEQSDEDSNDYENVLVTDLGGDCQQGPGAWCPSDGGAPSYLAGKLCEVACPAGSLSTEFSSEDA